MECAASQPVAGEEALKDGRSPWRKQRLRNVRVLAHPGLVMVQRDCIATQD
jgi:hypothetical protein